MNTEFFKRKLRAAKLKQVDISKKLYLSPSSVSDIFTGRRELKAREVIPLAELLNVEPIEILKNLRKPK